MANEWNFDDLNFGKRLLLKDGRIVTFIKGPFGNIHNNPMITVKFDNGEQKTISMNRHLNKIFDEKFDSEPIFENKENSSYNKNQTTRKSSYQELKDMLDKNFIEPENAINYLKKTEKYKSSSSYQKNALIRTMYK